MEHLTRFAYAYVLACALPLSLYVESWRLEGGPLGLPWSVAVLVLLVIAALALWMSAPLPTRRSLGFTAFSALALLAWAIAATLAVTRSDLFSAAFLATPFVLGMLAIKPPPVREALRVLDVFSATLLAAALATFLLQALEIGPARWTGTCGDNERSLATCASLSDGGSFRIPLGELLGLGIRSAGPFNHPNALGQAMALIAAYGLTRMSARWRWPIAPLAIVFLLLSGSRAGLVGAIVGSCIAFALPPGTWAGALTRRWRIGIAAVILVMGAGFWVVINPGLTGRSTMWPQMLDVWRSSPWSGVGQRGIFEAIASGALPDWASGGHNVVIDELARNGLIAALLTVAALAIAVLLALRAGWWGMVSAAALTTTFVVTGLADDNLDWLQPTVLTFPVIIATAAAAGCLRSTTPRE